MENLRQSLQKLAYVLKCNEGEVDVLLSVDRIEMLQNTIGSVRVAFKRQQDGKVMDVMDMAMNSSLANEENEIDCDFITTETIWLDTPVPESQRGLERCK